MMETGRIVMHSPGVCGRKNDSGSVLQKKTAVFDFVLEL